MLSVDDYLQLMMDMMMMTWSVEVQPIGNYAIVEDLFFALMWINLSVIMLMSMSMIPMVGKSFSWLGPIEYIECPTLLLHLIFSIIMYVALPDLLGDDGTYTIRDMNHFTSM